MIDRFSRARGLAVTVLAAWSLVAPVRAAAQAADVSAAPPDRTALPPLLVVLTDTGETREGLHVFAPHPEAEAHTRQLSRGFPATVVRLYRLEQAYLRHKTGSAIEPAYLEFSRRQGGFPGFGFWLRGTAKRTAGYVDLYEQGRWRPRFGAVDQIFPHELAHVMMQQLVGHPPEGRSTQGHALGVRTDPETAFSEGFAEHFQVMALDDPDADPGTRQLLSDEYWTRRAATHLSAYRTALGARWAPAAWPRIGFLFWFSGDEQVLRYYAVKANAFARQPVLPERLLRTADPYAAYLWENIVPAAPADAPRSVAQMLATEGVVSTFFTRWAASETLRNSYRDEAFYRAFDTTRADVPPLLNVYLKLAHALYTGKPRTTQQAIEAYKAVFPDEAGAVDAVVHDVFLGQRLPSAPEIWLANRDFQVGSWMFDQFRALPHPHTFDLNAASEVDLVAVPGVDLELARAIRVRAPYTRVSDLRKVPGLSAETLARFAQMERDMRAGNTSGASEDGSSLGPLLWSFGRRALLIWLAASIAGAVLFRALRSCGWLRAVLSGVGAAFVSLSAAWALGSALAALIVPVALFGVPAILWSLRRWPPTMRQLLATVLAWAAAALPAVLLSTPLF